MAQEIKHRRLYAFYQSKVLNALMITMVTGLLLIDNYNETLPFLIICTSLALLFFIAYSLWIWIKKPKMVIINRWLSDVSGCFVLYFLIVIAFKATNQWWYILPPVCAVVILFISLIRSDEESFIISE